MLKNLQLYQFFVKGKIYVKFYDWTQKVVICASKIWYNLEIIKTTFSYYANNNEIRLWKEFENVYGAFLDSKVFFKNQKK